MNIFPLKTNINNVRICSLTILALQCMIVSGDPFYLLYIIIKFCIVSSLHSRSIARPGHVNILERFPSHIILEPGPY